MEVFKRPRSKSWYVDLKHPVTGVRLRQSLNFSGSKVEAQKRANRLWAEMEKEADNALNGKRAITVAEALQRYIEALQSEGRSAAARDAIYRRDRLLGLSRPEDKRWTLPGSTWLHDLHPSLIEDLTLARRREGKAAQTIKHEIGLLRAATRYVVKKRGARGPVDMEWEAPEVAQKTRYLSPEEYARLVSYLDPHRPVRGASLPGHIQVARREVHDLVVALAYTGARWGELASLVWERVDVRAGVIRLFGSKVGRERIVPISEPLRAVLRRRLAERGTSPLVFPGPAGEARRRPSGAIGEAMDAVGLNDRATVAKYGRATIHSLRHTFASWLVQNGADLGEVADALGHSTLNMTRRYAHLSKSATAAKLGGILDALPVSAPSDDRAEGGDEAPAHQAAGG